MGRDKWLIVARLDKTSITLYVELVWLAQWNEKAATRMLPLITKNVCLSNRETVRQTKAFLSLPISLHGQHTYTYILYI